MIGKKKMDRVSLVATIVAIVSLKKFKAELVEDKVFELVSMMLNSVKENMDRKQKRLMYVDINITGKRKSALIDMRASYMFISEKAVEHRLGNRSVKKTTLEMLNGKQIDTKLVKLSVRLPPIREVGCVSNFGGNVAMQNGQLRRLNTTCEVGQRAYKPKLVVRLKVNPMFKVGVLKPIYADQGDLDQGKSQCEQVRVVDSCKRVIL
ncbi:hypothetical protein Goklo_027144 [Gossypium klotzschianum]|uniref:Uncharacterized protein n=1 Tax=Gossypium klotzschianum TaxID=34286 RepID=A0A7J8TXE4_9ROSI|nr:hypothetical protein [Gossypium klotzschianum]